MFKFIRLISLLVKLKMMSLKKVVVGNIGLNARGFVVKSIFSVFMLFMISANASAIELNSSKFDLRLYGTVYGYFFYEHYDKYSSDHKLDTNRFIAEPARDSFIGLDGAYSKISAKLELSINPDEILRQLYIQYNISDETSILLGRAVSIDTYDLSQFSSEMNALVNYGALGVHRKPMLMLSTHKFKIAFSPLDGDTFVDFSADTTVADVRNNLYMPHIETAYEFSGRGYTINIFGSVLYSSSTLTFTSGDIKEYDVWVAHIGSGGKIQFDRLALEYVVFGGMNIGLDKVINKRAVIPKYDVDKKSINDIYSAGGALQFGYNLTEDVLLLLGVGFSSHFSKNYTHPDTDLGAYINCFFSLTDYLTIIPEIAYLDDLSDGFGNIEGAKIYGGAMVMLEF